MSRSMYKASTTLTSQTAAQDLITITAASNVAVIVHEVKLTTNLTADERNVIAIHRVSAAGSGGSAATELGIDTGAPTADTAVVFGNTTQATPGTFIEQENWSVLVPYHHLPTPEMRLIIPGGGILVWELTETITSANISINVTWEEIG